MNQKVLSIVVCGFLSGFLALNGGFSTPSLVILLASTFVTLPLLIVGLSQGLVPAGIASMISLVTIPVFNPGHVLTHLLIHSVLHVIPVLGICYYALLNQGSGAKKVWYPASLILKRLLFFSLVLVVVISLALLSQQNDLSQKILALQNADVSSGSVLSLLEKIFYYVPAFFVISWLGSLILNTCLAQKILCDTGKNLRPWPLMTHITLPNKLIWVLSGVSITTVLDHDLIKFLGTNVVLVLGAGYFIVGLALGHRWYRRSPYPRVMLGIFYGVMFVLIWPIFIITLGGLLRPWLAPLLEKHHDKSLK